MNRKHSKIILSLCVIMAVIFSLGTLAFAAETDAETGYTYSIAEGEATLISGADKAGEVVIPSTLGNCLLTTIDERAFNGATGITDLIINDNIKTIGKGAFNGCTGLKSVIIRSAEVTIGDYAFGYSFDEAYENQTAEKNENLVIIGLPGSTAEAYATANGFTFEDASHAHSYEPSVTTQPTCTTAGVKTFTCDCGDTYTEDIPATGHIDDVADAKCDVCGEFLPLGVTAKITATTNTSAIKLDWAKVPGAAGYQVYYKVGTGWKLAATVTANTKTFSKLPAATKYTFAIKAGAIRNGKVVWASDYTQFETATQTAAPAKLTSEQNSTAIKLTWPKIAGATGYNILYKVGSSWKVALASTTKLNHIFTKLQSGTAYTMAVRGYVQTANGPVYGQHKIITVTTNPAAPATIKAAQNASAIKLDWTASKSATGYRIFLKSGSKWTTAATTTKLTHTFSKLPAGTKYTLAIKPYRQTSAGVVWGDQKEFTTCTTSPAATVTSASDTTIIALKWNAVKGADGYKIYFKPASGGAWKLAKTLTGTGHVFTGLPKGTTYSFAVRPCIKTTFGIVEGAYKEFKVTTGTNAKYKPYADAFKSGTFYLEITDADLGVISIATKKGNMYMGADLEGMKIRIIYQKQKDKWYMVMDDLHSYAEMPEDMLQGLDPSVLINSFASVNYEDFTSSAKVIGGKLYIIESCKQTNGSVNNHYFSGNTLVRTETIEKDGTKSITDYKKVTNTVKDDLFTFPTGILGYADISGLINGMV